MNINPRYEQIQNYTIIKRDGREEPFYLDKLIKVIKWSTESLKNPEIYIEKLLDELSLKINDKMKIQDLYDEMINIAVSKISAIAPDWDDIAKYLYLLKIYKEEFNLKRIGTYPPLSKFIANGLKADMYDKKIIDTFTEEEIDILSNYIDPNKDLKFNYKGLRLFFDKYCKGMSKKKLELPQVTYMAGAMHSHYNEPISTPSERKSRIKNIMKTYNLLSNHQITFSTPRISFSLSPRAQLASCVLITPADDTLSLNTADGWGAVYSKFAGGIAFDFSYIRARGALIKANSGLSDGPIPFIKRLEQTISSFNQMGRRSGSGIVHFPWWHMDVMELIMLKDAGGAEENRARKLKYAMKINRVLLDRIDKDDYVTLFDPKETSILNEINGYEFEKKYKELEKNGTIRSKKIKARELIETFFKVRVETGNLYVDFMDNINEQEMTGRYISTSNLCVSGDTKVLTKYGYKQISDLRNTEIEAWNGSDWSLTRFEKTGENQELYDIHFSNGMVVSATDYHKWIILDEYKNEIEIKTLDLKPGMKVPPPNILQACVHGNKQITQEELESNQIPSIEYSFSSRMQWFQKHVTKITPEYRFICQELGLNHTCDITIEKIIKKDGLYDTYCGNEPLKHRLVFNGIISSNCNEITVPSRPPIIRSEKHYKNEDGNHEVHIVRENGEIGLCNLTSIDSMQYFYSDEKQQWSLVKTLLLGMDNSIDSQFYPVPEAAWPNKAYRPIGIGVTNLANLLAFEKRKYSDDETYQFINDLFDSIYYKIYYSSMELAKDRGFYEGFKKSNWAKGLTPYHLSIFKRKNPLSLEFKNEEKWDKLAELIKRYGVRFSLHAAIAPSATNAKVVNATESCEPIMDLFYVEAGTHNLPTVVKGRGEIRQYYEKCWDISPKRILELAAIRQIYLDQSQSFTQYYKKPDSITDLYRDLRYAEYLGIKTLYYIKTPKFEAEMECSSCSV